MMDHNAPLAAHEPENVAGITLPIADAEPFGARSTGDSVLDAAARCIERKGIDNVSLEEVAAEAGVSRTTLYRRFGNRESLFKTLLIEGAKPFREWSRGILLGPGTVAERLETVLTHAIREMQQVGWLDRSLYSGMSPASAQLFRAAHADSSVGSIEPLLRLLIDDQAKAVGMTVDVLNGWVADQMIALASLQPWDEEALRWRLRYLVMPVLTPPAERHILPIDQRLDRLERKLDDVLKAVGSSPLSNEKASTTDGAAPL